MQLSPQASDASGAEATMKLLPFFLSPPVYAAAVILLGVTLGCAAIAADAYMQTQADGRLAERYVKIQVGMGRREVGAILGDPSFAPGIKVGKGQRWVGNQSVITIVFSEPANRVEYKELRNFATGKVIAHEP